MQKKRNIEIERLNGKINDNLSRTGIMVTSGVATSASSLFLGAFLFDVAGVSCTGLGAAASNVLMGAVIGGLGVTGLATIPLLLAGGYALKKLAS